MTDQRMEVVFPWVVAASSMGVIGWIFSLFAFQAIRRELLVMMDRLERLASSDTYLSEMQTYNDIVVRRLTGRIEAHTAELAELVARNKHLQQITQPRDAVADLLNERET